MSDSENVTESTAAEAASGSTKAKRTSKAAAKTTAAKVDSLAGALSPYAIIETGGKQYRVSVGDRLSVEKLVVEDGSAITFDRVLLVGGGGETRVGAPTVAGASVSATVEETYRGEKLVIFKYKAKKRYRRRNGHRQTLTRLSITGITA